MWEEQTGTSPIHDINFRFAGKSSADNMAGVQPYLVSAVKAYYFLFTL